MKTVNFWKKQNWWFITTILLFFFMPLSRAYLSFYAVFLPIFWIILRPEKVVQEFTPESKKLIMAMALLMLWQLVSLTWTSENNLELGIENFLSYAYWIMIPLIVFIIKKDQIKYLLSAFLLGMFVSELLAYGVFFGLWEYGSTTKSNPSPFMIHIEYSVFLALMGIILLERLLSKLYSLKVKVLFFGFLLCSTGNLFLTNGRTGQLAFLTGIFLLFLLKFRLSLKSIIYGLLVPLAFFILAFNFSDTFHSRVYKTVNGIEKLIEHGDCFSSIGQRICAWQVVAELVKDDPIIGTGIGDYKTVFKNKIDSDFPNMKKGDRTILNNSHLHNQFLMIIVQSGFIGLFLMFWLIYLLIKLPIKNPKVHLFKYVFVYIYFVSCLTEPMWLKQFSMVIFSVFISIFIMLHIHSNEKDLEPL